MKKKKTVIGVHFEDKQLDFIQKFAEKRGISKSEAIRIIVDMRRRQEAERGDAN